MARARTAGADDLDGVLRLMSILHPDEAALPRAQALAIRRDLLAHPSTHVLVIDGAESLIATCTISITPNLTRGGRPYAVIENVVTDPAHRRMGLGRAVLAAAAQLAWDADCYKVCLATGSKRESTLSFYESAGYTRNAKTYFEIRRP